MRIALAHPHPSPAVIGGAENLTWGLQDALTRHGHICDVIGQISPEANLIEVVQSYQSWLDIDLQDYDLVISGKYPSWMIQHRDHRLYLLHRLRGLYDTYPFAIDVPHSGSLKQAILEIRQAADSAGSDRDRAKRVLSLAHETIVKSDDPALAAYPGPYAREIVHCLDNIAISRHRIRHFAAISRTVAERAGYLPKGVAAEVLYPPPHRLDQRSAGRQHLFTTSRLDRPKRLDLLIQAMRLVRHDVPLLIAGSGPESARLHDMAAGDKRIVFLGQVSDEALLGFYANALAVPFVPFDEDYGLVTLEAMRSAAPVVTCTDSGGPCEFVDNGQTGYVTDPDPASLAAGLNRILEQPSGSLAMGEAARLKVAGITWDRVVEGLLAPTSKTSRTGRAPVALVKRQKLVLAATLPIFPPRGGGQIRVFQLYRNLARDFDIELVTLGPAGTRPMRLDLGPGLTETRVPLSEEHSRLEGRLSSAASRIPVTDIIMPRLIALTPDYRAALRRACRDASAVIACHPYLVRELKAASSGQPLWFEAQDVELTLKRGVFEAIPGAASLLDDVAALESEAWHSASFVFACTKGDLEELSTLYGPSAADTAVAPNGVALDDFRFTPWSERRAKRLALGLPGQRLALFMGSWHPPNVDAAEGLIALASARQDLMCLVAGSVCHAMNGMDLPHNVRRLGVISDAERSQWLSVADVALNPMRYGSGSNLKMLDYLASGIPVVTTPFGVRGLDLDDRLVSIAELSGFGDAIDRLMAQSEAEQVHRVQAAREHVAQRFAWERIAADLAKDMTRHLSAA